MPTKTKQYQLLLGTFIDNEFIWHDVDSFDTLEEAYKAYKKYVNDQLKYTDDELIKVWNTGRLDVELRRGNRLLNWTGIYVREVAEDNDEDENEKPKDKEKQDEKSDVKDAAIERVFEDERGWRVSESELRRDYEVLKRELPEETDYTFEEYLAVCTGKDGTLTEVKTGAVNTKDADDYHTRQAKQRKLFFKALGIPDDGRFNPKLSEAELAAFMREHPVKESAPPRGATTVEIYFEFAPYEDISYTYNFDDDTVYVNSYSIGD